MLELVSRSGNLFRFGELRTVESHVCHWSDLVDMVDANACSDSDGSSQCKGL